MSAFSLECFQNEYLAESADEVHAVVTITASGGAPVAASSSPASIEVIAVDTSGSMGGTKIRAAREATRVAIAAIDDGVRFAVVSGDSSARLVYPSSGLTVASAATRAEAMAATED